MNIYDQNNLSTDLPLFSRNKVLILGAGAVGTYIAEFVSKLGVNLITLVDFDRFTFQNAAKHAGIIRTPDDVGRVKSIATAQRIQPLMVSGGVAVGLDVNVIELGPMALSGFDAVFVALDNYAAKLVVNELFLRLSPQLRPLLFMAGTNQEFAQSSPLDGTAHCLRCMMNEKWLINSTVRTSCTDSPNLRRSMDGKGPVTSNLASAKAALCAVDDFRRAVEGDGSVLNHCTCWFPTLHPRIRQSTPEKQNNCPDCGSIYPPEHITTLPGCVKTITLTEFTKLLRNDLGHSDFEILTHLLRYGGVGYNAVIQDAGCRGCGTPMTDLFLHEGRITRLLCPDCMKAGRSSVRNAHFSTDKLVRAFHPKTLPAAAAEKTLFDLGWPIGGYISVLIKSGPDALDGDVQILTYTMGSDSELLCNHSKEAHPYGT